MRISTPALLLIGAFLFCTSITALALPTITITGVKHACGGNANGAFTVNVSGATGSFVRIHIFGPPSYTDPNILFTPIPSGGNFAFPVTNAPGDNGADYLVVVSDGTGNRSAFVTINDFTATADAANISDNTNANCTAPNGKVGVTLTGMGGAPIQYNWSGPGGPYPNSPTLTGLRGGTYTLSYTDGTTTCSVPPITIADPSPTDFTISAPSSVCQNDKFNVTISQVDAGYTYTVIDGASTVIGTFTAGATSTNHDIEVGPLSAGAHSIHVSAKQGTCIAELNTNGNQTVTVNPAPDYNDFLTGTACSGDALGFDITTLKKATSTTATSFTIASVTPSSPSLTQTAGTGTVNTTDDVWRNTTNSALSVTYKINTFAGTCAGNQITVTFSISQQPDYNNYDGTTPGICSNDALGVTLNGQAKGGTTVATSYSVTGIVSTDLTATSGIPSTPFPYTVSNTDLSDDKWQNVQSGPRNVVYTIVPLIGSCDGDPFTVTVKINPQPDYNNYNNNNAPGGICSRDVVGVNLDPLKKTTVVASSFILDDITFAGGTPTRAGGSIPTAYPATIGTNDLADDQWLNVTTGNIDVTYKIRPVIGTCTGNQFTVTVTIKPQPDYKNYNNDNAPNICSKDLIAVNLSSLQKTTSVAATSFSIVVDPQGMTQVAGASTTTDISDDKWENKSNASHNVTYTVTPTTNGCVGADFTVLVTVAPEPFYNNYADDNAPGGICSGDVLNIDLTNQRNTNSVVATAFRIISIVPETGLTIGAGSPVADPNTDKGPMEIADDSWINPTAAALKVTYTIRPKTACFGDQFTVVVTINPRPSYKSYNDDLNPGGICADAIGIDLASLKNTNTIDATSFDITVSAPGLTQVGGTASAGTGKASNEIADDIWSNKTSSNKSVTYTIIPKAGSCTGTQFTVFVTIKPQPDYVNKTAVQCSSDALGYDLNSAKNAASVVATVFTITNIAVSDPALVATTGPAALNTSLTNTAIQNDVWKNTTGVDQTVTYTVVPKEGTCSGASFDVAITIHPEPVYTDATLADKCSEELIGLNLDDQKAATSIAAAQFTFTTTASGTLTPFGANTTTTGTGNNMIIADDQWRNVTNAAILLTYDITPISADGCDGVPFKIKVNINPQPDYSDYNSSPGGVCAVPLAIDVTTLRKSTSIIATSFTVTMPVPPAGVTLVTDGGTPNDISDDVWANSNSTNRNITYKIVPSVNGCNGDSFDVVVTIFPTPAYNNYNNNNAPGGICSNDALGVDITTLKQATSAVAGSFTVTIDSKGMPQKAGAGTASDLTDDKWENTTSGALDVEYTITPKAGTCEGAPFTVIVTINPQPNTADIPWTICTGNAVNFNLQTDGIDTNGNGVASTFQWSAVANPDVTGETSGTTTIITDNLTNTTSSDVDVIYNVIPTSSPKGCVGNPFKVTVKVARKPVLGTNAPADICSGSAVNYAFELNPAGQPAGTTFTWKAITDYPNILGESTSDVTGATISDILTNIGTSTQIVTYTVTPSLGTCVGTSKNVQIKVFPGLIAYAGADQTICDDRIGGYQITDAAVSNNVTSFTWFLETNLGDGAFTLSDPTDVKSIVFTATMEGDYILRLETNDDPSGVCPKGVDRVTITVTKKPVIHHTPDPKTICGNDLVAYEILMDQKDFHQATVFTWPNPNDPTGVANAKPSPPGGVPMGGPGTIHINDELRNETNGNIDVTYTVTASVGICIGTTEDVVITVKPSPVVAFGQVKTICSGERVDHEILLSPVNTPAGTKFSWPDPDGSGSATSKRDVPADPAGTLHITDTLYYYDPAGLANTVTYQIISQGVNGCYGRTRDINISVNSGAIANAGPANSICSDAVLTLSGASVSGSTTFAWTIISQPGTDGVITNGATAQASTFKGTTPGTYRLRLTTGAPTAGTCNPVTDDVVITVKPIGDPSCTGTGGPGGTCTTTATITVADATCNNNDGSIMVDNIVGGTGPYTFKLNGTIVNLPANKTFGGLTANTYTLDIIDATSCTKTYSTVISFPGFVNYSAPAITDADCTNGHNGKVQFTITDPGSFEFAITNDLIVQPTVYNQLGGNLLSVNNLARGDYAIWVRPVGAGLKCATKIPVSINGVYAVSYTASASNVICFSENSAISVTNIQGAPSLPFAYTLTNTFDNSVRTGSISASQALSTYSITGITKGSYSLLITQDQSSVAGCIAPITGNAAALIVDAPIASLDTLYIKKTISVPDLPSGAALVGVAPSGREAYEVRLELVQPVFASQQYVKDWTEVPLNPLNLKFEYNFKNLYAGKYILGLRDSLGCQKNYGFTLDVDTQMFIPNIFTPNADGHNDVFYIRNLPADAKLLITNRWGNEVYKTSSYQNDWNGGDSVDGVYYYTVTVGGKKYAGWVEILRAQ